MNLTAQERIRFAAWLEHEAATSADIAAQMERVGTGVFPKFVVEKEKSEAVAALLIARRLRATESADL